MSTGSTAEQAESPPRAAATAATAEAEKPKRKRSRARLARVRRRQAAEAETLKRAARAAVDGFFRLAGALWRRFAAWLGSRSRGEHDGVSLPVLLLRSAGLTRRSVPRPTVGPKAYVQWWQRLLAAAGLAVIVVGISLMLAAAVGLMVVVAGFLLEQAIA